VTHGTNITRELVVLLRSHGLLNFLAALFLSFGRISINFLCTVTVSLPHPRGRVSGNAAMEEPHSAAHVHLLTKPECQLASRKYTMLRHIRAASRLPYNTNPQARIGAQVLM
jgi:hypothetical protein